MNDRHVWTCLLDKKISGLGTCICLRLCLIWCPYGLNWKTSNDCEHGFPFWSQKYLIGNSTLIHCRLRKLPEKFQSIPSQAVRALLDVTLPHGTEHWTLSTYQAMADVIYLQRHVVKILVGSSFSGCTDNVSVLGVWFLY